MSDIVAIIIARKGSQRLPGKNMKMLCGKPLVEWSIIQATCSKLVTKVIVSTDWDEVAAIGDKHGCYLHWRTDVKDTDPGNVPFFQAMNGHEAVSPKPDGYLTLLPTSPCKMPDDIDRAITLYQSMTPRPPLVAWMYRTKEFTSSHVVTDDDGNWIGGVSCIFDKGANFCNAPWGAAIIRDREFYKLVTRHIIDHEGVARPWNGINYSVEIQPWQRYEADTPEEWEDLELIFGAKIVNKFGADVYERYKKGEWSR